MSRQLSPTLRTLRARFALISIILLSGWQEGSASIDIADSLPPDFGIESIPGTLTVDHAFAGYFAGADGSGDWSGAGHGSSSPSGIYLAAGNQLTDQRA